MSAQDYLALRLFRLKPPSEWVNDCLGMAFVFPQGGWGRYVSGSTEQPLSPGDVLVLDAATAGKLSVTKKDEMVFRFFWFRVEHLFPLFAAHEISQLQNVVESFRKGRLYASGTPLAKRCHTLLEDAPPQFDLDHRSHLLRIAGAVLAEEFKTARSQRAGFLRPDEHLIQVFEKLSSSELLDLSVDELANKFGCSRRHLSRLFQQHFGCSVSAIRMEMRLLKAVSLLRNPDSKVIRVAEECGFNHLGLFNICFKRRFGATPTQWRKSSPQTEVKPRVPASRTAECPLQSKGMCPLAVKSSEARPLPVNVVLHPSAGASSRDNIKGIAAAGPFEGGKNFNAEALAKLRLGA